MAQNNYANDALKKETTITARFNPTTIDSPPGARYITLPDVPSGGTVRNIRPHGSYFSTLYIH